MSKASASGAKIYDIARSHNLIPTLVHHADHHGDFRARSSSGHECYGHLPVALRLPQGLLPEPAPRSQRSLLLQVRKTLVRCRTAGEKSFVALGHVQRRV